MSKVQHSLAHEVLSLIGAVPGERRQFTYRSLSEELGRAAENDSRAMAQVCDLLDAAAAIADVPLYALLRVRNAKGNINAMAWRKNVPNWVRPAVIRRSESHEFSASDIAAIARGLESLRGLGNRAAWKHVTKSLGSDELYRRIAQARLASNHRSAIDDLGSDTPERRTTTTSTFQRDEAVRRRVLEIAQGCCEYCRKPGFLKADGTRYVETHHIIALASDGADKVSNVVALCANHHREAHFGAEREAFEVHLVAIARDERRADSLSWGGGKRATSFT
ncbi:MAG: HNH endonuclease [Rhizobacter sp.]|nr:HNH endonuclease [Rhizobacter sp.]